MLIGEDSLFCWSALDDLHEERRPLYLKHADAVIEFAGKGQDDLIKEIIARSENV